VLQRGTNTLSTRGDIPGCSVISQSLRLLCGCRVPRAPLAVPLPGHRSWDLGPAITLVGSYKPPRWVTVRVLSRDSAPISGDLIP